MSMNLHQIRNQHEHWLKPGAVASRGQIADSSMIVELLNLLDESRARCAELEKVVKEAEAILLEDHHRFNHEPGSSPDYCLICMALSKLTSPKQEALKEDDK